MIKIALIILLLITLYITLVQPLSKVRIVESFKDTERLFKLPVVSMYEGDVKLNFLIDTGSTDSHIIPSILKKIHYTEGDSFNAPIYGYGANSNSQSQQVTVTLNFNSDLIDVDFLAHDMIEISLQQAFKPHNTTVHGILGNDFLKNHGYIIDYSDSTIKKRK